MQALFPDISFNNQQDSHEVYLRLVNHLESRDPFPVQLSVNLPDFSVDLNHSRLDQVQLFGTQLSYYVCLSCLFVQNIEIQKHYLLSLHVNNNKGKTLLQAIAQDYNVNDCFQELTCIGCTVQKHLESAPSQSFSL